MPAAAILSHARKPLLAALTLAVLAAPIAQGRAMDCGPPLAVQACRDNPGAQACGLLYLQIANLQEDGPVLHGLSLSPAGPVAGGVAAGQVAAPAAGQCSGRSRPLPPSDAGGPDSSCIAYLVPACRYGLEARFGDGSHVTADAVQVDAPAPDGATAGRCATLIIDLGRQQVTQAVADCGTQPPGAPAAAAQVAGGLGSGDVTAVTPILSAKREP